VTDIRPSLWRVVTGLIVAPGIAAAFVAALDPAYNGLSNYFERVWRTALALWLFGGLPFSLVIGFPAYFALRDRIRPTTMNCAIVGAVAAALPWFVIAALSSPDSAFSGGGYTVIDGKRTLHGWLELAKFVGSIALAGGLGGVAFWVIAASPSFWRTR
jgi:hypothetical protein